MESNISHNGYVGMIEMISPFSQNFDKSGSTRLYRTVGGLEQTLRHANQFAILLKIVYLYGIKDLNGFDKINDILLKFDPNVNDTGLVEKIKKDFPKKKNN